MTRLLPFLLALFVALVPMLAEAAPPVPARGRIVSVEVEGTRRIEEATVLAAIRMRAGEELSASKVRRDLRGVYATGFFDDVKVDMRPTAEGVAVVFVVDEKPAVRDVRYSGNKKVNDDDVSEAIDIRTFTVLNDAELKKNADRIRDVYVEKGFYLAEVTPIVRELPDDQVEVVFEIQENRKVVIQRVDFTGNENIPDKKIERYLQLKEGGILPWLSSRGNFKAESLDEDAFTIRYVFLEDGYVDVQVGEPNVYLSPDKRSIFISYHIEEGEQYSIGAVDVTGDFIEAEGLTRDALLEIVDGRMVADVQEEQWREATENKAPRLAVETRTSRVATGEVFKYSTLQLVMSNIQDFYSDQGYAFVNVIPLTQTHPETQKVDITFQIDTGPKMRIGRIDITGNDPTFDKVVRRELLVNEGEIYRGSRIKASRQRLERLGYFDEVNITTPRGDGEDVLDLSIGVSEQPTGSFSFGIGYSNLESFVLTGNVQKNNFLGLGYLMSAAINWSGIRRQWNLSLYDPYFLDSRWTFRIDGFNTQQQFQLNQYQRGASMELGRYLDARNDMRLGFSYTFEDVGLTSLDPFTKQVLGRELYRSGLTSSIGVNLTVDKRNNRIQPTKGFYMSLSSELAGGFRVGDNQVLEMLGGDFNFVENRANFRLYQPIIPNSELLVFRVNSTLGRVDSTDGRIIPFIHRFRAGGINSVRGFNWFSLGPSIRSPSTDDPVAGDDRLVVGGNETWVNNIEIESPILKSAGVTLVAFFDAGNAFGDPWGNGHINPLGLRTAVGGGVRWRSPIGPLRFEWGFPLKPLDGERKQVFDFSIGSFF
ncbi:MAG: outer membrane protein assembly factor BamA [Deltaproteobacteria bacterium]|nr:MAG: outer membrane protein assembly factor BamA [Deltaproteobacteria bacterium]